MPGRVLMEENGTADDAAALLMATAHEAEFGLLITERDAVLNIEARDRLSQLLSAPITENVADVVDATSTQALVDMVAFHDLLARVVNDMPSPEQVVFQVKWQQDRWRKASVAEFPGLRKASGDGGLRRRSTHHCVVREACK